MLQEATLHQGAQTAVQCAELHSAVHCKPRPGSNSRNSITTRCSTHREECVVALHSQMPMRSPFLVGRHLQCMQEL